MHPVVLVDHEQRVVGRDEDAARRPERGPLVDEPAVPVEDLIRLFARSPTNSRPRESKKIVRGTLNSTGPSYARPSVIQRLPSRSTRMPCGHTNICELQVFSTALRPGSFARAAAPSS
jgi:hypothetical protein